ncbi:hypothetical protein NE237_013631 [Protea cynaroides]|uniref:Uncharacterized protein n=1 Tax=Protea cynaroides TaxID=273540 RepID=A0A9Q0GZQ2_9MAGN|nr:hypothetical protein NE237_013631 [Protea cynaroides]
MKQKIVIKVTITGKKSRPKAMRIAVSQPGVESVAFQGEEKEELVVIGDGVDSIVLITHLRRSLGYADLLTVGDPDGEKKEEKETKNELVIQPVSWPTIYQNVQPYFTNQERSYNYQEPNCSIM